MFDELKQSIRDIEFLADPTVGQVRIGCPESMTAGFVPAILDRVSRHNPHVVVHVVNAQTVEREFRELTERRVDLMMGALLRPLPNDDVNMEGAVRGQTCCGGRHSQPVARRRKIELSELMNER